jgi:hypothetical protein
MVKLLFQHGETPRTYQAARRTIWRRAVRDRSQVTGFICELISITAQRLIGTSQQRSWNVKGWQF